MVDRRGSASRAALLINLGRESDACNNPFEHSNRRMSLVQEYYRNKNNKKARDKGEGKSKHLPGLTMLDLVPNAEIAPSRPHMNMRESMSGMIWIYGLLF